MGQLIFPTDKESIYQRLQNIKPESYVRNRNFLDGDVTRLSPYISRGFLSTKEVYNYLIDQNFDIKKIEKFIMELAWRDYWQQIWIAKGEGINADLKTPQSDVENHKISTAFLKCQTNIDVIDKALKTFYKTGYLHNHVRMYIAAMACNVSKSHWLTPARWMYYHLLDADWASNALSWQWVAGSNSHKKYVANQENINKYSRTSQTDSYLDVSYQQLVKIQTPEELSSLTDIKLKTQLPKSEKIKIEFNQPTLIYNFYNLDPTWHANKAVNRILLLEPKIFEKYPVSENSIRFMINLSKNIPNIQVYCGSFEELISTYQTKNIIYKEHPLNKHYVGIKESRDWMFAVDGYFPSFFKFWKECKKQISESKNQ